MGFSGISAAKKQITMYCLYGSSKQNLPEKELTLLQERYCKMRNLFFDEKENS